MFKPKNPEENTSAPKSTLTHLFEGAGKIVDKAKRSFNVGYNQSTAGKDEASSQPIVTNSTNNNTYGIGSRKPPKYKAPEAPPLRK